MFLASALIGIGNGTIFPLINLNIGYNIPKEKIATAMSINGFFIYMGQFFSPIIVNLFNNSSNSIRFPFYFGAVLCIILFIVFSKINLDVEKN